MRNRLSIIPLLLITAVVGLFGVPAAAQADYKQIFTDCGDGTIDGTYTAKEFQDALRNLDAYTGDYSECSDAIVAAQLAQGSGRSSSGGKSSSDGGGTGGSTSSGGSGSSSGTTTGTTTQSSGASQNGTANPADPQTDARGATADERAAALAAATAAADKKAGKTAADLKNTGIPAAARIGDRDTSLPGPLLLTLIACAGAACLAGGAAGLQALRRRRGR